MDEARAQWPRRLRAYWTGWAGGLLVGLMALCALLSPQLAPHDPFVQDVATRLRPPVWARAGSAAHLLGTDHVGRDYLSRIIYGARVSLAVGLLAVLGSGAMGVVAGLLMGFYGGAIDRALTFLTNVTLTFPFMLLAIVVIALMGAGF